MHSISETETQTRHDLAALYRLLAHYRMTDLVDTHISARIPGTPDHFLINRYGVLFEEMTADTLIKIDPSGIPVDELSSGERVNAAGFNIHSAVHMARHDLQCVIHTHTADGIAVSSQEHGLLPISQHALKFYGRIAYHDYEGVALSTSERQRLVDDLGPHSAMILRNHGLLAAGRSIAEAFVNIYFLERACQAQIRAMSGSAQLRYPSPEVCIRTAKQFDRPEGPEYADLAWHAARRLVEPAIGGI